MAVYYVDPDDGNDGNAGTSPGAALATIDKVMDSTGPVTTSVANTIWLKPSLYRENVSPTWTLPTARQTIQADWHHEIAWTTAPTPGMRRALLTNHLTSWTAAGSGYNIDTNPGIGLANQTFKGIYFHVGSQSTSAGNIWARTGQDHTGFIFEDCVFYSGEKDADALLRVYSDADVYGALTGRVSRCVFAGGQAGIWLLLVANDVTDYDENTLIENNLFLDCETESIDIDSNGAGVNQSGGIDIYGNTFVATTYTRSCIATAGTSTTHPCVAKQNKFRNVRSTGLSAGASGELTSDENIFNCETPRNVNVTKGTNDDDNTPILFDFGAIGNGYSDFMPMANAPAIGFGTTTVLTTEDFHEMPRPGGGSTSATVGAFERVPHGVRTNATVGGDTSWKRILTGPGVLPVRVAVKGVATSIEVDTYRVTASYSLGTRPKATVLANPAINVTETSSTATASADDLWQTLTINITPNSTGVVTLLLENLSSASAGVCYFKRVRAS